MITTLIAIGVIVLLGLIFLHFEHHTRKIKFAIIALIILALYLSITAFFSSEETDLSNPKGIVNTVYVYFGWLGETTSDLFYLGKDTVVSVGNAIKINNTQRNLDGRR